MRNHDGVLRSDPVTIDALWCPVVEKGEACPARKDNESMDQAEEVDRLFRDHARELYRYLRTFRLSEEDTYDLVQDVYTRLLDAGLSKIHKPRVWLFTVGRNLAINRLKRDKVRRADGQDPDAVADGSPGALSGLLEQEVQARLWQAFAELPARDQEMMILYLEHEFSYRQIAEVTGRSEISVRVAMHRSRNQLKRRLRPLEMREEMTEAREALR
jgi:RNA polymerase sigma factor (sigma-70 family)